MHQQLLAQSDLYTPQVLRRVLEGAETTAATYQEALRLQTRWTAQWVRLFAEHNLNVVAHPTLADPPPVVDPDAEPVGPRVRPSLPWSLTGFPALTIPVGLDSRRLPVGLTLAAVPDAEADLLAIGCTLDEHLGFWRTAP